MSCGLACLAQGPEPGTFAGLYLASRSVVLQGPQGPDGTLPVQTVVEGEPAGEPGQLRVRHQDRYYQADASAFVEGDNLLSNLARREEALRLRHQTLTADYAAVQRKIQDLQQEAAWWASSARTVRVVFPAPAGADQGQGPALAVTTDQLDPRRAVACRHELRKVTRSLATMEQQLAALEMQRARLAGSRAVITRLFTDFRVATRRP